jgi:hypothetical protein
VRDTETGAAEMSRSRRSEPITGITAADSEKEWKRQANRRLRHAVARTLHRPSADPDAFVLPVPDEVANQYDSPKEGKYCFDPRRYPRFMRK